jgi:hypothetical protein
MSNKRNKAPAKAPPPPAEDQSAGLHGELQAKQAPKSIAKYRWKPGQSGNPSGRRKGSVSLTTALKNVLAKGMNADRLAQQIYDGAMAGDAALVKVVLDRVDGTVAQQLDAHLSGFVHGPIAPTQLIIELPPNNRDHLPKVVLPQPRVLKAPLVTINEAPQVPASPVEPEQRATPEPPKREPEMTLGERRKKEIMEAAQLENERIDRANQKARESMRAKGTSEFTPPPWNPWSGSTL